MARWRLGLSPANNAFDLAATAVSSSVFATLLGTAPGCKSPLRRFCPQSRPDPDYRARRGSDSVQSVPAPERAARVHRLLAQVLASPSAHLGSRSPSTVHGAVVRHTGARRLRLQRIGMLLNWSFGVRVGSLPSSAYPLDGSAFALTIVPPPAGSGVNGRLASDRHSWPGIRRDGADPARWPCRSIGLGCRRDQRRSIRR